MFELLSPVAQLLGQGAVIGAHLVSLHSAPDYHCGVDRTASWQAGQPFPVITATERRCDFRTVTPGLYVRMPSGLTAGAYVNSVGGVSAYGAWTVETEDQRFALTVGGVTGYHGPALQPLLAPSVRFDLAEQLGQGWAMRLTLIPKPPRDASAAALHLSLETRL